MFISRLGRVTGGTLIASIAFTMTIGSASTSPVRHTGAQRIGPPAKATLKTVLAEGGTLASIVYRGWMDYWGLAIPGDTQGSSGGPIDGTAQLLYAAVGTGGAQADVQAQQSGWNDTTPSNPPNFNGSPAYGGAADTFITTCSSGVHDNAQCGYQPTAGVGLEPRDGTSGAGNSVTPDSLSFGGGDAPLPLTGLAIYNNSNGQASGYNLQRGPVIQYPLVATAVSIVFNPSVGGSQYPGITVPSGGLKLSRNSLCGIFEGQITNWNDPSITADNGGRAVTSSEAITLVHRSDGSGTTFLFTFTMFTLCSQADVSTQYAWGQGIGTGSSNSTSSTYPPTLPSSPSTTVIWPENSTAEKGSGGVATEIASQPGAIAYLSPSFVSQSGGYEAYVENTNHAYIQATVAGTKAAIASGPFMSQAQFKSTFPSSLQWFDYPYIKNTYLPLPSDPAATPIAGYTFGYFYACSPFREDNQFTKLHAFVKWAMTLQNGGGLTAADKIAENNGLVELPDKSPKTGGASKKGTNQAIGATLVTKTSHSGSYVDPTTGDTLNYTCTPLQ